MRKEVEGIPKTPHSSAIDDTKDDVHKRSSHGASKFHAYQDEQYYRGGGNHRPQWNSGDTDSKESEKGISVALHGKDLTNGSAMRKHGDVLARFSERQKPMADQGKKILAKPKPSLLLK